MSRVHELLYNIKSMGDRASTFIRDQAGLLECQPDWAGDWSSEAGPVRDMKRTAQELRAAAAIVDNLRERMLSERT